MNHPIVAAGYVRVSTENQIENYSVEEQTARIRSYCAARGWALAEVYADEGFSGGNLDRPALKRMLRDISSGSMNAVVVYKLDRLSRNQKDTMTLIEDTFLRHGVDFISVNENFDTSSPFGRAMIGILSVFAQLEKDQIVERFTMGRIGRSKAGFFHGGPNIPMGYRYENGELIVDPCRAEQVREVYRMFLRGMSINGIYREMSSRYDGNWSAPKVRSILTNTVYIGRVKFKGEEHQGRHSPIISEASFNEVRSALSHAERKTAKTRSQNNPFRAGYLLSGLVRCDRCGARYSANHGYYKCYSRSKSSRRFVLDPNCLNTNWKIAELDALVFGEIIRLLSGESIRGLIEKLKQDAEEPEIDRITMVKQLGEIEKQAERLLELYQVGSIPMKQLKQRIDALTKDKEQLEKLLTDNAPKHQNKKARTSCATELFRENYLCAPLETRRFLVGGLIDRIRIDGCAVSIEWRV